MTGTWFTISCSTSGAHTAVVTGGPTTFTLNPDVDFTQDETCTTTIVAAQVSDQDANDPPDTPAANHVFTFSIDASPSVTTTVPVNAAAGVPINQNITINFTEPVNIAAGGITIACPVGTPIAFTPALPQGPVSSIVLDPATDLPANTTCTVTVVATSVTDADANDPPDAMLANHVFTFSTDAAPFVVTTLPANGAVSVLTNANIDVTFSEPVAAAVGAFNIGCVGSGPHAFALSGGPATYTLNPDVDFTPGESCTITVLAVGVSDVDPNDPPDTMLANHVFSFTLEGAPFVQTSVPAATGVHGTSQNLSLTFNEPVTVTGDWFQIVCATTGTRLVTDTTVTPDVTGAIYTINPNTDFVSPESCTLTVTASLVADQDANDPPDVMLADAVILFTIDVPPGVQVTDPVNGSTNAGPTQNITITFTEPVDVSGSWFSISCTTSGSQRPRSRVDRRPSR